MSGRFEASDALLLLLVLVPPPLFATQDWFSIWLPATEMRRDKEEKKHRLLIYVDGTTGGGTEEAVKLMFMWLLPTLFLKVGEDGRERRRPRDVGSYKDVFSEECWNYSMECASKGDEEVPRSLFGLR